MSSPENISTSPTKRRRSSVHSTKVHPMYERNTAADMVAGMDLSCNSSHLASDRRREDICSPHAILQTPTRSWGSNRTRAKSDLYRKSPRVSPEKQTSRKQNRRRALSSGLVGKTVLVNNTGIVNQYSIDSSDEDTISSIELETGQVFSDFELPQLPPRKTNRSQRNCVKSDPSFKAADIPSRNSPMSTSSSSPIQIAYNVQSSTPDLRRKSKSISFSKVISPTWQRRLLHLLTILSLFIILWYDETTNHEMDKAFAKNYERRTANTIHEEGELAGIRTVENFSGWHLTLANPQDEKKVDYEHVRKRRQPRMAEANSLSVQSNQQVLSSNSVKSFTLTDDEIKKKIDETFRKYRARNISPKRSGSVIFAWAFLSLVTVNVAWRMGTNSFRYLTLYIRNATNIYSPSLSRHAHEHCR